MLKRLQRHPLRYCHALAMVAMMLVLAATAFRLGQADLIAVRAENTLNAVRNGQLPQQNAMPRALGWVKDALAINRHYAPYIELQANIHLAGQLEALPPAGEPGGFQEAVSQFRQLAYVRPTWAFGWAGLILAKVDQLEFDDELTRALEHTATRYPYLPQVQMVVATSALSAWEFLEDGSRQKLMQSLRYAYSLQPETLKDAAESFGEPEVLCPLLQEGCRPE
jgi:hypothetical protein